MSDLASSAGPTAAAPEITGDEIGAARERLGAMLRGVRAADGSRAAAVMTLAAVLAAVDGAFELGIEGAALNTLRMCISVIEGHHADQPAGEHGGTRH